MFKASNIGAFLFFALNASVVILLYWSIEPNSLVMIAGVYLLSVALSFTSFGDWVLCLMTGAKRIRRLDMKLKIVPLLEIVYNKAKRKTPGLTNKIVLKVHYSPEPNAFAIGRRTICVTEGLLHLPDDVVQGILAHEVAHLAHKHTHVQLLIGGANFIMTAFMLLLKLFAAIIAFISIRDAFRREDLYNALPGLIVAGIIWLWTKFCMLFLMWSSRKQEFEADAYVVELGYGEELAMALDAIGGDAPGEPLLKALYSTHPHVHDRIGKMQELGVNYSRY